MRGGQSGETMSDQYGVPDRENPAWTAEEIRSARPGADVLPPAFIAKVRRHRGKQKAPTKRMVSLRVAPEVLEAYRSKGKGWQGLMHDTLAAHAPRQSRGTGVRRAGRSTATTSSQAPVRTRAKH